DSCNTLASEASTSCDALTSRPCSSHVYHVGLTAASAATSSRRRPGVRRRPPDGSPTSSGRKRARRLRRNSASSCRWYSVVSIVIGRSDCAREELMVRFCAAQGGLGAGTPVHGACGRAVERSLEVGPHGLDLEELLQRLWSVVAAEARILVAAKRHVRVEEAPAVDPHRAGLESGGHPV